MTPTVLLLDKGIDEGRLTSAGPLDLRDINDIAFERVLALCQAPDIRLYHVTARVLDGIERLGRLRRLSLEWAPKIPSLAPAFRLSLLEALEVVDSPKVSSIDGIGDAARLTELRLAGGMWKPLRLRSLRPLLELPSLERLTLQNLKLDDDDITCLAHLPRLSHLHLSNQFEREQVAAVARALNHGLEEPIQASWGASSNCPKCGQQLQMFTGRRMPFLCARCNQSRFERLTREFAELVGVSKAPQS